ncbi:unnamed protein product [Rhodiola kirilowii]
MSRNLACWKANSIPYNFVVYTKSRFESLDLQKCKRSQPVTIFSSRYTSSCNGCNGHEFSQRFLLSPLQPLHPAVTGVTAPSKYFARRNLIRCPNWLIQSLLER